MEISNTPVILYPPPYLWFLFVLCIAIGIFLSIENAADFANIQYDWANYRCQPQMIPLAGLFGHDVNENFQFCLNQIIQESTSGVTAPFTMGMFGFTEILMNLMNSANSFRTMLATLVGGVIKIVGEFKARMTALMGRVKLTASRMKAMMYRVYGTMFAVIYMGLSAQTALTNFGDTFIFKFIDTFCFPPHTPILLETNHYVPISKVCIGDVLSGGHRVETIYAFAADGQEMVLLGNVEVSSNHFVLSNGKWVMAKDHPDATPIRSWTGGNKYPLICLTTHDHSIHIGGYQFADYDETEKGNQATQAFVHKSLNGLHSDTYEEVSYDVGVTDTTEIQTVNGYMAISDIRLGYKLTEKATVIGVLVTELTEFCILPNGIHIAPGTLLWNADLEQWIRACKLYPISKTDPKRVISLFVNPGSSYILKDGTILRDAMEIYSPETKKAYADILLGTVEKVETVEMLVS